MKLHLIFTQKNTQVHLFAEGVWDDITQRDSLFKGTRMAKASHAASLMSRPGTKRQRNAGTTSERLLFAARQQLRDGLRRWKFFVEERVRLTYLSDPEISILRKFIEAERDVVKLDVLDGSTHALYEKGFVRPEPAEGPCDLEMLDEGCPYRMHSWVRKYLTAHPKCLA